MIGRKLKGDRNIQLGHAIAHGLDMIELMEMYDMTAEEIKFFHDKHNEFISLYESGNPDHIEEITGLFHKLKELTGYEILEEVEPNVGSGVETESSD